jgi:hypothetical protein
MAKQSNPLPPRIPVDNSVGDKVHSNTNPPPTYVRPAPPPSPPPPKKED